MLDETIILGFLQGLTEFLPVSSSGHLVAAQNLLGLKEPQLLLDILLHVATAMAVVFFYRKRIAAISRDLLGQLKNKSELLPGSRLAVLILLGTAGTGVVYFLFKSPLRAAFGSTSAVGVMLIVTAGVLTLSLINRKRAADITPVMAVVIGLVQGLAITPGLSRSGLTIVAALLLGTRKEKAVEFSMLLSLPAIAGALVLELQSGGLEGVIPLPALLLGSLTAIFSGLLALKLLVWITKSGKLYWFAPYCLLIGIAVLVLL